MKKPQLEGTGNYRAIFVTIAYCFGIRLGRIFDRNVIGLISVVIGTYTGIIFFAGAENGNKTKCRYHG